MVNKKILIFHPTVAPYRIDFFNDLSTAFETKICLKYKNLKDQHFRNYDKIVEQFYFDPVYLKEIFHIGNRCIYSGIWKQLNHVYPDIVIVGEYGLETSLVLLHRFLFHRKYKIITICDDSYNMVTENNDFTKIHKIFRSFLAPKVDDIILVEPSVTRWYRNKFHKGFWFPIIKDEKKARSCYTEIMPISRDYINQYSLACKNIFLFVGRLVKLKNVEFIIRAFAKANINNSVLVIVGSGPEEDTLKALANQTNADIIFTGRLEGFSIDAWYNIATALILASYQESFGAVTNEALIGGCYGLVSNKAGSRCLIEEGVNGYTFSPNEEDDLVEKMKKLSPSIVSEDNILLRPSRMIYSYKDLMKSLLVHISSL
jgi:glycosyltransferase involved in cell wall biosynthesis